MPPLLDDEVTIPSAGEVDYSHARPSLGEVLLSLEGEIDE